MTTKEKATAAASVIHMLDRVKDRYDGQEKAVITTKELIETRELIWKLLERLTSSTTCPHCEAHPAFELDKWLFTESRDNPLAAAAAVNIRKAQA